VPEIAETGQPRSAVGEHSQRVARIRGDRADAQMGPGPNRREGDDGARRGQCRRGQHHRSPRQRSQAGDQVWERRANAQCCQQNPECTASIGGWRP